MGHDLRGRYKDAPAPSIALYMPRRGLPILWRKGMPQANRNGGQKSSKMHDDHDDHDDHDNLRAPWLYDADDDDDDNLRGG